MHLSSVILRFWFNVLTIKISPFVMFLLSCFFSQTRAANNMDDQELTESMQKLLILMKRLDQKIAPMLEADGELFNKR